MADTPSDDEPEEEFDEVLLEFLRKHDAGVPLDREAFLCQYPEHREQLSKLLEAADWIEQLSDPSLTDLPPEETPHAPTAEPQTLVIQDGKASDPGVKTNSELYDPNAITIDAPNRLAQIGARNEFSLSEKPELIPSKLSEFPSLDTSDPRP